MTISSTTSPSQPSSKTPTQTRPKWSTDLTESQYDTFTRILIKAAELQVEIMPYLSRPVSVGPIVTSYHVICFGRTSVGRVETLATDLAATLAAEDVIVKRYPGDGFVSIEVPNPKREYVLWRDSVGDRNFNSENSEGMEIPLWLGVTQHGKLVVEDLTTCPHLLISGTTGSGKSTLVRSMLTSMLLTKKKTELNLYLSDTKQVEFNDIAKSNLVVHVDKTVDETYKTMGLLIREMNARLKSLALLGVKNIQEAKQHGHSINVPYIVFVIDELADIMTDQTALDKDESPTGRATTLGKLCVHNLLTLVQKGRAPGIHVIACTQRPSVDIVKGGIKANMPARLSFRLPSGVDSRTILDTEGAEHLMMKGDMLYISPNHSGIKRIHAPFASEQDIKAGIEFALTRR